MNAFLERVKDILKQDERLFVDDKILKNKCIELSLKADEGLIKLLLENTETKEFFFKPVLDALVFESNKFNQFISNEAFLDDSYTAYKNKIGLATDNTHYLAESSEVVLNWPYKDCVLEGGQDKDDAKRKEVFWNEILGHDQQDTLLAPKVLEGFKRITKDGEEDVKELSYDDNLIIKGNNLLALHTLKKRYAGKVKLIYIDPPYNTGNDSFGYNDSFNHSTWLTFMKNRLEVARTLLKDDGVIFVQCDDNEQAYLKVLMDDIFGRDNFINLLVWLNKEGGGKSDSRFFIKKEEYTLAYARSIGRANLNRRILVEDEAYSGEDEYFEDRGRYKLIKLNSFSIQYSKSLDYEIKLPTGDVVEPSEGGKRGIWRWSKEQYESALKNGHIVFKENQDGRLWIYTKQYFKVDYKNNPIQRSLPYTTLIENYSATTATKEQEKLFGSKLFSYPKPEGFIMHLIAITTVAGDIVLDYHLGSGTTAAVTHKMGRRYIGIEQMAMTVENVVKPRLNKVIDGEQGGISKAVNWQGGGSYVCCHLKNNANSFIKQVQAAVKIEDLVKLLNQIKKSNFLSYRVDTDKLEEAEFSKLRLDIAKGILIDMVEKNKLYVNYLDIDDVDYKIDENTKKLNAKMQSRD